MTKRNPPAAPPRAAFTEHRPRPASAKSATKSAKNTAKTQPSGAPAGPAAAGDRRPKEIGGPKGPEPTRYGDWERDGRCIDF